MPLFVRRAGKDVIRVNDLIWQTAAGGLLRAARVLEKRCGVPMPAGPALSPQAAACLESAAALASHGKTPGDGLQALAPAFGRLEGRALATSLGSPWQAMRGQWQSACPQSSFGTCLEQTELLAAAHRLREQLEAALASHDFAALDSACEQTLAFLPLLPGDCEDGDLSLYDYARLTAALAGCFAQLTEASPAPDCPSLREAPSLLLFSCDFSGIQSFLYLISTKSALKMLRSRSFYLELVMEHLIDELLELCGLARCNCLYAGGGHAYVLLPNTPQANAAVQRFSDAVNAWLREQFGMALYLACGAQPCSPAALFGLGGQEAYSDAFRSLSAQLGHAKLTRCSASALRALNHAGDAGRECRICGRAAAAEDLCGWCSRFASLGSRLTQQNLVFAITGEQIEGSSLCLPMPGAQGPRFACLLSVQQAQELAGSSAALRWYSKNETIDGLLNCRRLWMGDHCPTSLLEELNRQTEGITRMGVFRADVDNLGKAFISGFAGSDDSQSYVSLARTMALSRSLSVFFKCYINEILAPFEGVLVVYSGGDDLFLVGGWSELLEAARQLKRAFDQYTGGTLTFSGGFGLYTSRYPIARAAQETALLEDCSKSAPGKNAITLFAAEESLRFDWPAFEADVMGQKYALLQSFFGADENGRGNAFLYRLLECLRTAEDRLNLARCAYLLARLQPDQKSSDAQKKAYATFSRGFYAWALEPEARRQLIAAIYLYVYLHRKQDEEPGGKQHG